MLDEPTTGATLSSAAGSPALDVALVELRVQPTTITCGMAPAPMGTLTLSGAAPAGGVEVALASSHSEVVGLPPSARVAEGASASFFELHVDPVVQPTGVVVSATYAGVARVATLMVLPAPAGEEVATPAPVPPPAMSTEPEPSLLSETEPVARPAVTPPVVAPPAVESVHTEQPARASETRLVVAVAAGHAELAPTPPPQPPELIAVSTPQLTRATPADGYDAPDLALPTEGRSSFRAALLTVLPAVPILAAVSIIVLYITPAGATPLLLLSWLKANPLLVGSGFAVLIGLLTAALHHYLFRGAAADQANAGAYSQLSQRLRELDARLGVLGRRDDLSLSEQSALDRAHVCRDLVRSGLARPGPRWMLGTGYINLWTVVHSAEEALLGVEPVEDVVGAALYDELRLQDSQIDNSSQLLAKLRLAVLRLAPDSVAYLSQPPSTAAPVGGAPPSPGAAAAGARAMLRDVRGTLNEFRDSSWGALVRTRNHLFITLTITGVVTYLLLAVAISGRSSDAPADLLADSIAAAASFYLVGASVGLLNRLYGESQSDNAVEDYGLTMARLSLTPVLSGLAAVGGVLIIAILPATVSGDILSPSRSAVVATPAGGPAGSSATAQAQPAAAPAAAVQKVAPRLEDVYNLRANPFGIVLAAVFGLAPSLLIGTLQNAADKYRSGLSSTNAQAATKT